MQFDVSATVSDIPSAVSDPSQELQRKINSREARVGIVGLGYVGLPLAIEFARSGFRVTGIDSIPGKWIRSVRERPTLTMYPRRKWPGWWTRSCFRACSDYQVLAQLDTVNICVPTPLRKTKDPDLSYILAAVEQIQKYLHRGMLVILESTTYPGTTEEFILPRLSETGLEAGRDFFLCFSRSEWTQAIANTIPATSPRWSAERPRPAPRWVDSFISR